MKDPQWNIEHGIKFAYNGRQPADRYEAIVLGILADLNDRRGIKSKFGQVDDDVREEIVTSLAAIVRSGIEEGIPDAEVGVY